MQLSGRGGALRLERCCCYLLLLAVLNRVASWDYSTNGADSWASLGACGGQLGGVQSPVDLPSGAPVAEGKSVILKYPRFENSVQLYHNGYSIAMTLPEVYKAGFGVAPSKFVLSRSGAEAYRLWQVNFHAPSEHTFEGKRMPLEVQLVHQRVTGSDEVAILVVLFTDAGEKRSNFLDAVIGDGLPSKPSEEKSINGPASKVPLNFAELVRGSPYFQYEGSLTVPPCSPKVRYVVRTEPALAASTQLQQFETILKDTCGPNGNYRMQPPGRGGADIAMLPSLDITSSPEVVANAEFKAPPGKGSRRAAAGFSMEANSCQSKINSISDTFGSLNAGDSLQLRAIKARYNQAVLSLRSAQAASSAAERNLANAQQMYDSATGYCGCEVRSQWYCNHEPLGSSCLKCPANPTLCSSITTGMPAAGEESCRAYCFSQGTAGAQLQASGASKADLFWRVHAAKQNIVDTSRRLADADHESQDALAVAMKTVVINCILAKKREARAGGKRPPAVMKELVYDNDVKLPRGLAASPFSSPMGVGVADVLKANNGGAVPTKLAPNLHQQDGPPDSIPMPILKNAEKPTDGSHDTPPWLSQITATMKLPIPVKDLGDSSVFGSDLAQALAASAAVSPNRIHVTEIHKTVVQDIALIQKAPETVSAVALLDRGVPSEEPKPSSRHRHGFLHASKLEH